MENFVNGPEIPLGFGMALSANLAAMNYFSGLPEDRRRQIIEGTHGFTSKEEMQAYVNGLLE